MSPVPPASSDAPAPVVDSGTVRLATAGYAAVLLAALVATTVVAVGVGGVPTALVGAAAGAIGGAVTGWLVAARIGHSWRRGWTPAALSVPFLVAGLGSTFGPLDPAVAAVGWLGGLAVFLSGSALGRLSQNRYVESVVAGEPLAQSRWQPPGSLWLDLLLVALASLLSISFVFVGHWLLVTMWTTIAITWLARSVDDGRLGRNGRPPAVQVYENGIVRRRRFTAKFVPWEDVAHARLRDGEIVVDWGLFDLRVDSASLADPDGLFDAIEDAGPMTIP